MNPNLLIIDGLTKRFDGIKALDEFSCIVQPGEILGLIGPNGAGKTTLFNVITGFIAPDKGKISFREEDITGLPAFRIARMGISRTFQDVRLIRGLRVIENVMMAYKENPGERIGPLIYHRAMCVRVEAEYRKGALALLETAGLRGKCDESADALSYGQQKLLSLVCCLAAGAEVLLLDEPVAGIAPEMLEKILTIIRTLPLLGKTVIIIEHNIDAIMSVCGRIVFMDTGMKIAEGKPEEVRNDPRVIEAYIE